MKIRCIKFSKNTRDLETEKLYLEFDSYADIRSLFLKHSLSALIIKKKNIKYFLNDTELTVDRGTKNKARSLASLLLNKDKIPVIRGSYKNAGQFRRSCRTFLRRAGETVENNLYIIGINENLFDSVWESQRSLMSSKNKDRLDLHSMSIDDQAFAKKLLDLLPNPIASSIHAYPADRDVRDNILVRGY